MNYSFKKLFNKEKIIQKILIQKIWKLFIQKIINLFEKLIIAQGYAMVIF